MTGEKKEKTTKEVPKKRVRFHRECANSLFMLGVSGRPVLRTKPRTAGKFHFFSAHIRTIRESIGKKIATSLLIFANLAKLSRFLKYFRSDAGLEPGKVSGNLSPMRTVITAFVFLFAWGLEGRTEGLPLDLLTKRKIVVEHTILDLSDDQIEESIALSSVTLTAEQWETMRKVSKFAPKRLISYPNTYNDCMCGTGPYGIALPGKKFGIVHYSLDEEHSLGKVWTSERVKKGFAFFTMDARGQFYLDGRLVPYASVKQEFSEGIKLLTGEKDDFYFQVTVPPGMKRSDPTLKDRIAELEKLVTEAGARFFVL